jgi:hypothetical protein
VYFVFMHQNTSQTPEVNNEKLLSVYPTDPVITYPSYKSLDEYIDVERLVALDGYITSRIKRRLADAADLAFYTGPYKLQQDSPALPGTRMVYLSRSTAPDRYLDLDRTELWQPTEATTEFALLMDFIHTLPFKATGRMIIMYDIAPRPVSAHRDHMETDICHDFIWFRTNKKKPFYMLNHITDEKQYVDSYSAWFDGVFTDEFKALIPQPEYNIASTPSYWACLSR